MTDENARIHNKLGRISEAVNTIKESLTGVVNETSELHENSMRLTALVEQMAPMVAAHEEIAGSIKKEYVPRLDEHHAHVEMLIRKAEFWQSVREQMVRKSAVFATLCFLAAMMYLLGFENIAQKMIGLGT